MSRKLDSILLGSYDAETVRLELIQGAYYHCSQNLDDSGKRDPSLPLMEDTLAFVHEIMHWYQDVGTLLGIAFHYFHDSPVHIIQNISKLLSEQYSKHKITLPLYPVTKPIERNIELADLISHAALYNILWDVLDGEKVMYEHHAAEVFACVGDDAEDPQAAFNYWLIMSKRLKAKSEKLNRQEQSSPIGPSNKPIGCLALQEGQARAIEEMSAILAELNGTPISDNFKILDPNRWAGKYRIARDYMRNILCWKNFPDMTKEELFYRLYAFSAICDLAMATPISPRFFRSWAENYSWKDYHPGWRFHKLCHAMKFLNIDLRSMEVEDYNKFVSELTGVLGWRDANEIYSTGTQINNDSILEELSKRFFHIRSKHPNIMINPLITATLGEQGFTELLLAIPPPLCGLPGNYRSKIKGDELLFCIDPPLRIKGLSIDNSYLLQELLKCEKYGSNLAHQIIWTGKKPKSVPQAFLEIDPIMLVTGLSEDSFEWQ